MPEDLACIQIDAAKRGKWHVPVPGKNETACGVPFTPQKGGVTYRYLDLIDGKDRCKTDGCVRARLVHKGLA